VYVCMYAHLVRKGPLCVCGCVCMCVCMYVCIYAHSVHKGPLCVCACVCMYVCMCVCVCVCMYVCPFSAQKILCTYVHAQSAYPSLFFAPPAGQTEVCCLEAYQTTCTHKHVYYTIGVPFAILRASEWSNGGMLS
jgi:hypothetical protein